MNLKNALKEVRPAKILSAGKSFLIFTALPVSLVFCLLLASCCLSPFGKREIKEEVWMEVTAYCACQQCTGWERRVTSCFMPVYAYGSNEGKRKKVGITSSGRKARKGAIAADLTKYPYGTKMYIPGYGWGEVQDKGSAIKGNHIDIFFADHDEAIKWGRKKLKVTVKRKK
jgi:3D (Asp-Asp-Asp) domain-containing protein